MEAATTAAAPGDAFVLQRMLADAEEFCFDFRELDATMVAAAEEARTRDAELATALHAQRAAVSALCSRLLAHLCRTTRSQEAFAALRTKAMTDAALAEQRAATAEAARAAAEEELRELRAGAGAREAALAARVEELEAEGARLELEAMRPEWQWRQARRRPVSRRSRPWPPAPRGAASG